MGGYQKHLVNGEDGAVSLVIVSRCVDSLGGMEDTLSEKIGLQLRPERQTY